MTEAELFAAYGLDDRMVDERLHRRLDVEPAELDSPEPPDGAVLAEVAA